MKFPDFSFTVAFVSSHRHIAHSKARTVQTAL